MPLPTTTRIVYAIAALLTAAAIGAGSQEPAAAPAPAATENSRAYRLVAGDAIEVRMFFNPELNETVQIRPDGRISLQLIGDVELAGKTVAEAAALIDQSYAKHVRTPRATVQVRSFASQKIFVTGEVVRPGMIGLPGRMNVLEALSEAGGIKRTADRNSIVLIRKGQDGRPVGTRLTTYAKGNLAASVAVELQPFDVIVVPESRITRLDMWIDQHIRQVIPVNTSAGFTYLISNQGGGGIPVF